jgi:hypothetical protein
VRPRTDYAVLQFRSEAATSHRCRFCVSDQWRIIGHEMTLSSG